MSREHLKPGVKLEFIDDRVYEIPNWIVALVAIGVLLMVGTWVWLWLYRKD